MTIRKLDTFLLEMFSHQLALKMFHFQTESYGAHKASDAYLIKFEANLDQVMEVAQGIFGKVQLRKVILDFSTLTDSSVKRSVDHFLKVVSKARSDYHEHPEMTTILEMMMADAQQLKYLLTFK